MTHMSATTSTFRFSRAVFFQTKTFQLLARRASQQGMGHHIVTEARQTAPRGESPRAGIVSNRTARSSAVTNSGATTTGIRCESVVPSVPAAVLPAATVNFHEAQAKESSRPAHKQKARKSTPEERVDNSMPLSTTEAEPKAPVAAAETKNEQGGDEALAPTSRRLSDRIHKQRAEAAIEKEARKNAKRKTSTKAEASTTVAKGAPRFNVFGLSCSEHAGIEVQWDVDMETLRNTTWKVLSSIVAR